MPRCGQRYETREVKIVNLLGESSTNTPLNKANLIIKEVASGEAYALMKLDQCIISFLHEEWFTVFPSLLPTTNCTCHC